MLEHLNEIRQLNMTSKLVEPEDHLNSKPYRYSSSKNKQFECKLSFMYTAAVIIELFSHSRSTAFMKRRPYTLRLRRTTCFTYHLFVYLQLVGTETLQSS